MTVLWSNNGKVTIQDVSLRFANVTTTERNALNNPANGDMIYNTTTNALNVYKNGAWTAIQDGSELQGMENLVEDTSPQLGGNLDVNGNNIDMGTNIITDTFVGNWNTAYGWGDHSTAGYQTTATFDASVNTHINRSSATSGQVLSWDGSDFAWTTLSGGGSGFELQYGQAGASGATLNPGDTAVIKLLGGLSGNSAGVVLSRNLDGNDRLINSNYSPSAIATYTNSGGSAITGVAASIISNPVNFFWGIDRA